MPVHSNVRACTHIKVTGVRCGSPALRGEPSATSTSACARRLHPAQRRPCPNALIENEEAIQASLMEVINALIRNTTTDLKRAELILRALHIAERNARRVHFSLQAKWSVKSSR